MVGGEGVGCPAFEGVRLGVLLPEGFGDGGELGAGQAGQVEVDGLDAPLFLLDLIAVGDADVGFGDPVVGADGGEGFDLWLGLVGEVELVVEPDGGGTGHPTGTVACAGEPEGFGEVGAGAGDGGDVGAEGDEEGFLLVELCDEAVFGAVEDEGWAGAGAEGVECGASIA